MIGQRSPLWWNMLEGFDVPVPVFLDFLDMILSTKINLCKSQRITRMP
uniref:Uncharacterized protein n=1 Tax=Anguilla anguilla TaxID=7936 RepID=A0A0E9VAV4_ANGAN